MKKRISFLIISLFIASSLFAKTSIDEAISNAAVDIADKCNAKAILLIDDFESSSSAMTFYIREQLADSIFAEDGLIQIVTREHMDKIEKELKFQNTGLVSEKTILSVAERLGAKFIVFGKLEEFNGSYILRVRMLDVESGSYDFQYSPKTEQLLGRAPKYKKASLGLIAEVNKNSLEFIAPAIGFTFDYSLWRKISAGSRLSVSYDLHEKKNELVILETLAYFRFYIVSLSGEPVSGLFTELEAGASTLFINTSIKATVNGGAGAGYRFIFNNFYLEPEVRFGYPYLFACGISAGMRF